MGRGPQGTDSGGNPIGSAPLRGRRSATIARPVQQDNQVAPDQGCPVCGKPLSQHKGGRPCEHLPKTRPDQGCPVCGKPLSQHKNGLPCDPYRRNSQAILDGRHQDYYDAIKRGENPQFDFSRDELVKLFENNEDVSHWMLESGLGDEDFSQWNEDSLRTVYNEQVEHRAQAEQRQQQAKENPLRRSDSRPGETIEQAMRKELIDEGYNEEDLNQFSSEHLRQVYDDYREDKAAVEARRQQAKENPLRRSDSV